MTKNLVYTVHSSVVEKVNIETTFRDKPIRALVDGLTVELVGASDGNGHGHTFRFVPDDEADMAEYRDLFSVGKQVRVSFETDAN